MKFKKVIAAICCTWITLSFIGCSAPQSSNSTTEEYTNSTGFQVQTQTANVGDEVTVETKKGTLKFKVEGFQTNASVTKEYREKSWFPVNKDSSIFAVLLFTVENVSYETGNNDSYNDIKIGDYIAATEDGAAYTPPSSGDSTYGEYGVAFAGYIHNLKKASKAKCALPYEFLNTISGNVLVKVEDTQITVPVTAV